MSKELLDLTTLNNLPKRELPRRTMLDILDVATKEIYITQAYAYFLDHKNGFPFQKQFATIFFKHILASEKSAEKWLRCDVRAEQTVQTKDKSFRIDLLFINGEDAIIVENKIFAGKYNNLNAYEEGVKNLGIKNIIKSCFLSFDEGDKRSITHQGICLEMRQILLQERSKENEREYYQMSEFIEHLVKLNQTLGNIEDAIAYLEHTSAINNAIQLKQRAMDFFYPKIREIAEEIISSHCPKAHQPIDDSFLEQKQFSWIHVRPKPNSTEIYLTIAYEDFLQFGKDKPVYLIIESTDKSDKRIEMHFKEMVKNHVIKRSDRQTSNWRHYFFAEVKMNESEKFEDFLRRVQTSACKIFEEIVKFQSQK